MAKFSPLRQKLRAKVADDKILVLPGVHDVLSGLLAELSGAEAVIAGGYAAHASLLGQPDIGELGLSEMADFYSRLCDRIRIPVVADADTGYGDAAQIPRTIRAYERAGVAGLIIEDQTSLKRCGHMQGKRVIPVVDMLAKLKAALDARSDPSMIIIARTDARDVEGLEAAIERAQIYCEIGVDMIFVEAPLSAEEMRYICAEIPAPCLANNIEGGKSPVLPASLLEDIGYAAVAFPASASYLAAQIWCRFYTDLVKTGSSAGMASEMLTFNTFNELIGLMERRDQERKAQSVALGVMERLAADRQEQI